MKYTEFKQLLLEHFSNKQDVQGIFIVGSYARGNQKFDSDIDACISCIDPKKYLNDQSWISYFGEANEVRSEKWGPVQTVRAFFKNGPEIEFNFSTLAWADIPVDPGTRQVVSNGIEILYDPTGKLLKLKNAVDAENNKG